MPRWLNLLKSIKSLIASPGDVRITSIDADQARSLLDAEPEIQIVDVRQPKEYRRGHLPGARLLPVADLDEKLDELAKDKPVLVYCAIGGRSKVAAHMLAGRGFERVLNLSGGFKAWNGWTGFGDYELGLEHFSPPMSLERTLNVAYLMEAALEAFYRDMTGKVADPEAARLFQTLADVEVKHKAAVARRMEDADVPKDVGGEAVPEGGMPLEEHMRRMGVDLTSVEDIVDFAMAVEAQALDLYSRAAFQAQGDVRSFLETMAVEEKTHLRHLGELLDRP
ncbi:rhodanese-like domain-containing protein [Desulfonatronum sp. SC1]|uniref:rhodanese-like domain-containing protein n=1 Tax=Desulfonatronum sp. SC1 TaxID=2109626 RepID=UPI000D325BA2|nr:rhodanese-like domain-containing protein [Desulfonatronum sp. SC1]PTN35986.1 sulfurtransferase [Desulfonatronum sp. SC1]